MDQSQSHSHPRAAADPRRGADAAGHAASPIRKAAGPIALLCSLVPLATRHLHGRELSRPRRQADARWHFNFDYDWLPHSRRQLLPGRGHDQPLAGGADGGAHADLDPRQLQLHQGTPARNFTPGCWCCTRACWASSAPRDILRLLPLLRIHADPDVLHHRHLGRARTGARPRANSSSSPSPAPCSRWCR